MPAESSKSQEGTATRPARFDRREFSRREQARLQVLIGGPAAVMAWLKGQFLYALLSLQGKTRSSAMALFFGWLDVRRLRKAWKRPRPALAPYESRQFSQNGEDGILETIFCRIGKGQGVLVEIGAADGEENCTRSLVESGWTGLWIEADSAKAVRAVEVAAGRLAVLGVPARPETVAELLRQAAIPERPDLVVLDIDGNDWWVLGALLQTVQPRVLVAEYNATFPPGYWWVKRYEPDTGWDRTFRHGASLEALVTLTRSFGLRLLGCDSAGVNAFFVAADQDLGELGGSLAIRDGYVPPWFSPSPWGHPRSALAAEKMTALSIEELGRVALVSATRLSPRRCLPGQPVGVGVLVRNGSATPLSSDGSAPVHLATRWRKQGGHPEPWDDQARHPLVRTVAAGEKQAVALWTPAPASPGEYALECTLVQENVAWLDGLQGATGLVGVSFLVVESLTREATT